MKGQDLTAINVTIAELEMRRRYHNTLRERRKIQAKRSRHPAITFEIASTRYVHEDIIEMLDEAIAYIKKVAIE